MSTHGCAWRPGASGNRAFIAALLLALQWLAGCAGLPQPPTDLAIGDDARVVEHLERSIPVRMKRADIAGLSIAIVDDQRVLWARGFGVADPRDGRPATAKTVYRTGSVSKLFTALAALQMAERGRLDLDQPLGTVVPALRGALGPGADQVTPRRLMSHQAGLARDRIAGMWGPQPASFAALAASLTPDDLPFRAGAEWHYSNLGVTLLGHAVQEIAGIPFGRHLQQAVLAPIGMASASFGTGLAESADAAYGARNGKPADDPPLRDVPAGGLSASVLDLARFLSMVFAGGRAGDTQVVSPATIDAMFRPQNDQVATDLGFRVGLGWMLSTLGASTIEGAGTVAHHAGATMQFRSQVYALPRHRLGVVVLANSPAGDGAVDRIATEALALLLQARTGIAQPRQAAPELARMPMPAALLETLPGDYATLVGRVRIVRTSGGLAADALGRRFALEQRTDGQLRMRYALLGVLPVDVPQLDAIGLTVQQVEGRALLVGQVGTTRMRLGERLAPQAISPAWRARIGRYRIVEPEGGPALISGVRVLDDDGVLVVEVASPEAPGELARIPLVPQSDTLAILADTQARAGEHVRIVQTADGEEVRFSGYRLKRSDP